jgi:hypothetical protein
LRRDKPAASRTPDLDIQLGPKNAWCALMKAVTEKPSRRTSDFYNSTLAPVHRPKESQFGILEFAMLSVLFLELFVFVRLFIAN